MLYAGGDGIGVWKSHDGGATWRPAVLGLASLDVTVLAPDPASPDALWVGTRNRGLFHSRTGGELPAR